MRVLAVFALGLFGVGLAACDYASANIGPKDCEIDVEQNIRCRDLGNTLGS